MKVATKRPRGPERGAFPTTAAYFAALPDGWESFPSCLARAALLGTLRSRGALDALDTLPPPLQPLVGRLATDEDWLPEVVHVGALLAVRDARFSDSRRADDDFLAWMAQLNRDLLAGPMIADALGAAGPTGLVPRFPELWQIFHRGTPATLVDCSPEHARFAVAHPRQLFPALAIETHRRTLAMAFAKAGAVAPHVATRTDVAGDEATTMFEATWR